MSAALAKDRLLVDLLGGLRDVIRADVKVMLATLKEELLDELIVILNEPEDTDEEQSDGEVIDEQDLDPEERKLVAKRS